MTCDHVRALSTPYVDGDLPPRARGAVETHLARCPACREALVTERRGRAALVACRDRLRGVCGDRAPDPPRQALAPTAAAGTARPARRLMRLPLAATLALAGAGVVAYGVFSHNATLVAAQLTLDHLKCIYLVSPARAPGPEVGEQVEASAIQAPADAAMAAWERTYGWRAVLPGDSSGAGFNLVAIRRCLHGQGFVAHALYRRGDHLVSLFVFRGDVQTAGVLAIMGERAAVWSQDAQTYAVIGANSPDELNRLVALTRRSTTGPGL